MTLAAPVTAPAVERLDWPDWWVASADALTTSRCRTLWVHVLAGCLADSLVANSGIRDIGVKSRRSAQRVGAYWWRSAAMREVADLAGFNGAAVQERLYRKIAAQGIEAVAREMRSTSSQLGNRRRARPDLEAA